MSAVEVAQLNGIALGCAILTLGALVVAWRGDRKERRLFLVVALVLLVLAIAARFLGQH